MGEQAAAVASARLETSAPRLGRSWRDDYQLQHGDMQMESASLSAAPAAKPSAAAPEPHLDTHTVQPPNGSGDGTKETHDRRIALIGSISGSRLLRLRHMIRHEYRSRNGDRSCARLRGGSVDCSCDYCAFFWSRLEERLR